jgi:hypothetical protein
MEDPKLHSKQDSKDTNALDHLKNADTFKVPEGYFEQLPAQVLSKIRVTEKSSAQHTRIRKLWLPITSAAAILGGCALLFFFLIPTKETPKGSASIDLSYPAAIEQYLQEEEALDEESIVAALVEGPNEPMLNVNDLLQPVGNDSIPEKSKNTDPIILDSTITNDDILQYLLDEGYDFDPNS